MEAGRCGLIAILVSPRVFVLSFSFRFVRIFGFVGFSVFVTSEHRYIICSDIKFHGRPVDLTAVCASSVALIGCVLIP